MDKITINPVSENSLLIHLTDNIDTSLIPILKQFTNHINQALNHVLLVTSQ